MERMAEITETMPAQSDDAIEERFLESLEHLADRQEGLLNELEALHRAGRRNLARSLATMLQPELTALDDKDGAVRLWRMRCAWQGEDRAFRKTARDVIAEIFRRDPLGTRIVRNAGWDDGVPTEECVRRIDLLLRLKPGVLCLNKTWGAGVVARVDDFYEKVAIDFKGKPGHELTFAYAAESLEVLDDDHLLARRHREPDALKEDVAKAPDVVVRQALASFGDMPVPIVAETLDREGIVREKDWKSFWDAARRKLKQDTSVEIPSKRNNPLRLLSKPKAYDAEWAADFRRERDMKQVLVRIAEAVDAVGADALDAAVRDAFADRIAFVLHGATGNDALYAPALLVAQRLGIEGPGIDPAAGVRRYLKGRALIGVLTAIPARDLPDWLALMWDHAPDVVPELLEEIFAEMTTSVLGASIDALLARGEEERVARALRQQFSSKVVTAEALLWLARRMDRIDAWGLVRPADLPNICLDAMAVPQAGERLRARNQLGQLFEDRAWLQTCLDAMTTQERREILARVRATSGGAPLDRTTVSGRIINMYPDAKAEVREGAEAGKDTEVPMTGVSSWRSLRARQDELKRLAEVEIPKNSQEIALARSYGDLRENHEYKSAKEMQGILLQRHGDIEEDLRRVQGSDFAGFAADRVGMGTQVRIRDVSGEETTYNILGEWDRNEEHGVISSASGVALALAGHRTGDRVALPSAEGEREVTVLAVDPISEELKTWARGD